MKKIFLTSLVTGFLICMFLLLSTCKQSTEPGGKDETGLVVPGVGMDGIKLGDSKETVLAKFGEPSEIFILDGLHNAWQEYKYYEGSHAGLTIYLIEGSPEGTWIFTG